MSIAPFEGFTAKDGSVIVGAGKDKIFEKLCSQPGKPEWMKDPRFSTNAMRTQNVQQLKEFLDAIFVQKTIDEWLVELDAAGIPCGPINTTIDRVVRNPQINAGNMIVGIKHL